MTRKMIRAGDLDGPGERKGRAELHRIRAAEMLCMELEGVHREDIAAIYKVTPWTVGHQIRSIPAEARAMIEASPERERLRGLLALVGNPPRPFASVTADRSRTQRSRARERARKMLRRGLSGEPLSTTAADFGTTPARVVSAILGLSPKDRVAIEREAKGPGPSAGGSPSCPASRHGRT